MTHTEAEQEISEVMGSVVESVREQADRLAELFGIEESKVSSLVKSSTKRSTFNPNDSTSVYGGQSVISQSLISSSNAP